MRHYNPQSKKARAGSSAKRKPRQRNLGFSPNAGQTRQIPAYNSIEGRYPAPKIDKGLTLGDPRVANLCRIGCLAIF